MTEQKQYVMDALVVGDHAVAFIEMQCVEDEDLPSLLAAFATAQEQIRVAAAKLVWECDFSRRDEALQVFMNDRDPRVRAAAVDCGRRELVTGCPLLLRKLSELACHDPVIDVREAARHSIRNLWPNEMYALFLEWRNDPGVPEELRRMAVDSLGQPEYRRWVAAHLPNPPPVHTEDRQIMPSARQQPCDEIEKTLTEFVTQRWGQPYGGCRTA